jgi:hypothetical protein
MAEKALGICEIAAWPGNSEHIVTLPGNWHSHLAVSKQHDKVILRAGNRRVVAHAVFTDEEEVQMTTAVRQELCLPLGPISVKAVHGELHFGPFVGVYALPSQKPGKPFGELTALLQDMTCLAAEQGVGLYVFLPGEIDWREGIARCYVYKSDQKHWVRTKRPLPDLVLPKIMGKPPQWRGRILHDMTQIARRVPFGTFSNATGQKWNVHQTLAKNPNIRPCLPETRLVKTPLEIDDMLNRHHTVYVKPIYGTQGKSIYRLTRQDKACRVQFTQNGRTFTKRLKRPGPNWEKFLQKRFCAKRSFLVQQGIDLLTDRGGRPVDFRWLVQKDGQNNWHITARIARIGGAGSITTNLHTGGVAVNADDLLKQTILLDATSRADMLRRLDTAAFDIATTLEAKAGQIGELGIDFGVTKAGDIYMIEVNPRPGRQMLNQTSKEVRALSLQRNIEYAKYTTGFEPQPEG